MGSASTVELGYSARSAGSDATSSSANKPSDHTEHVQGLDREIWANVTASEIVEHHRRLVAKQKQRSAPWVRAPDLKLMAMRPGGAWTGAVLGMRAPRGEAPPESKVPGWDAAAELQYSIV